ncbi:MAG: hypothetical protein Q8Q48_02615, partial [Candidatus Staskawiczbacteria bacterium]|nr:hypothetical protein [Candidatus Staskawiczbacteria bacterium]
MKKINFILVAFIIFTAPALVFAHTGASLEDVLSEIKSSQNVSENSQIKCENVSEQNFEELGDAVMGVMHPDESQHELMDNMMGGEGSQSLKAAHIYMGKQYLGCTSGISGGGMMGGGMMGMMGSGGMMGDGLNYQNMMGGFSTFSWFGFITMALIWVLLIVGIVAVVKW